MPGLGDRLPLPEQHIVGLVVGLALDRLTRRRWPPWTGRAGVPLVLAGVLVTGWAVHSHGGQDLDRPGELVRGGAYAWSRNPMYLGWSMIHVGTALARRSPGLSVTWPVAVLLVHRTIRAEEAQLTAGFGADFTRYAAVVPRYLGPGPVRDLLRSARARARRRPPRSGT